MIEPLPALSADTSPEIERRQIRAWRDLSSTDKGRLITAASQAADRLALAGIRTRHPDASDRECFLRLAVLKLGLGLAVRAYPEVTTLQDVR